MNRTLRYVAKYAVSVLILGVLVIFVPVDRIEDALSGASLSYFLLGLALQFVTRVPVAIRVRVIAESQGFQVRLPRIVIVLLTTHFYTMFLPGPLAGGGITWWKLVGHGATRSAAAVTVVLNRGIGLLVTSGVGTAAWIFDRPPARSLPSTVLLVSLFAAALAVAVWFLARRDTSAARSLDDDRGADRGWRVLSRRSLARLARLRSISTAGWTALITASFAHEILAAGVAWSFARAVGIQLDLLTIVWIRSALQILLLLPITIGGLGLREVSLVGLGGLAGIAAPPAVAWSLATFAGTTLVAVAGGLIEAVSTWRSGRTPSNRVPQLSPDQKRPDE